MIPRDAGATCVRLSQEYPVLAILGPRQSGKTTLARKIFSNYTYISLEDLDARTFAKSDPRGFLATYHKGVGVVLDEIQHVPELLSYIQTYVDQNSLLGSFIITGSHNFLIHQAISQTLAGRIAIVTLLPLCLSELQSHKTELDTLLFTGFYPRIHAQKLHPSEWHQNYVRTYVEKEIRLIKNVTDLTSFQRFMKLCAGRIGQLVNYSSLASDCGIDHRTVKSWLSLLEMSYIIFLLPPYYDNFSKRLVKMPKLFFYDTGLASYLLGITSEEQISTHYLRGGLFESIVLSDLMKQKFNNGEMPNLYFWRDRHGHEVDCVVEHKNSLFPIEIKSGQTISQAYFEGLVYWNSLAKNPSSHGTVVYGGEENQTRKQGHVIGWKDLLSFFKSLPQSQ